MNLYTFTPNPVLDLGGTVDRIVPNEKVYVVNPTRCPGGNGINVARVIRRLGMPVTAGGFLGGGIGDEIQSLLRDEGVTTRFIPIRNQTRVNVTVSEKSSHLQTRLSFPGPKIQKVELEKLFSWLKGLKRGSLLMVGGSFPPGFSDRHLMRILKLCRQRNIGVVVDSPGPILKNAVRLRPLMIKPNLTEFQELLGKKVKSLESVLKQARLLSAQVPIVCVSSVAGGAVLVTQQAAWFGRIPRIRVKSVVGAGDSMVGAMIEKLARDQAPIEDPDLFRAYLNQEGGSLLRFGLASACASLSHQGTALGTRKETYEDFRKTQVIRLDGP